MINYNKKKYKLKNGQTRWLVRVWSTSGTRFFEEKRLKTLDDVNDFIKEKTIEFSRLEGSQSGQLATFGDLFSYWVKEREEEFSPGTRKNIPTYWKEFKSVLQDLSYKKINHDFLRQQKKRLIDKGNSHKTIKNKLDFIKAVLNFALENNKIAFNPAQGFKYGKFQKTDLEIWQPDEAMDFLEYVNEIHHRDTETRWVYVSILTALNTGLRSGELWALQPLCLKHYRKVMRITQQIDQASRELRQLKGKDARSVPLNDYVLEEIQGLIEANKIPRKGFVFTSTGKPVDHNNFRNRIWNPLIEDWGGMPLKFHGTRHFACTEMLRQGINVATVKDVMGHKSIETTMKYVHFLASEVEGVANSYVFGPRRAKVIKLAK